MAIFPYGNFPRDQCDSVISPFSYSEFFPVFLTSADLRYHAWFPRYRHWAGAGGAGIGDSRSWIDFIKSHLITATICLFFKFPQAFYSSSKTENWRVHLMTHWLNIHIVTNEKVQFCASSFSLICIFICASRQIWKTQQGNLPQCK